jgi:hypothetical protein
MSRDQRPIDRIAPDDLPQRVDADVETIDEAVEWLHKFGGSSTPPEERPRCPECQSQRVYPRDTDTSDGPPRDYDTPYVCANRHHFDDPVYLDPEEVDHGAAEEESDPFVWVTPDDLEEPPLRRQLAELDDRRLAALVIYLYRPWSPTGPSYRDLESILPYSSDWVGDRVRAWKDGDHRDLVRDPRPRVTIATDAEEVSAE